MSESTQRIFPDDLDRKKSSRIRSRGPKSGLVASWIELMPIRRLAGLILWFQFTVIASGADPGGELSVDDIVRRFENVETRFSRFSGKTMEICQVVGENAPPGSVTEKHEGFNLRDGADRIYDRWAISSTVNRNGKISSSSQSGETSIIGENYINIVWMNPKKPREVVILARLGTVGSIDSSRGTERRESTRNKLCEVFWPYKEFNRQETRFSQLFRVPKVSVQWDTSFPRKMIRLESRTEWGIATVWLDPQREDLPVRISLVKGSNDWFARGKSLTSLPSGANYEPKGETVSAIQITHDLDWGHGQGFRPNLSIRTHELRRFSNGQDVQSTTTSTVTELTLNPGDRDGKAFEIQSTIPDGTRVEVQDEPHIVYEWRGGRIVKVGVISGIAIPEMAPNATWWRWGLALGLVAIVLYSSWRILRKG